MLRKKTKRGASRRLREGAAAVEAAICIPVVIVLMLGTLEISAGIYLKESLTVAAYEGARAGVKRRATFEDVQLRCQEVLNARSVTGATVVVTPTDFSSLNALDPVTVRVTAPSAGNCVMIFDHMVNRDVSAEVIMAREFTEASNTTITP
jgi:Flp pilus assembly protein TadG